MKEAWRKDEEVSAINHRPTNLFIHLVFVFSRAETWWSNLGDRCEASGQNRCEDVGILVMCGWEMDGAMDEMISRRCQMGAPLESRTFDLLVNLPSNPRLWTRAVSKLWKIELSRAQNEFSPSLITAGTQTGIMRCLPLYFGTFSSRVSEVLWPWT